MKINIVTVYISKLTLLGLQMYVLFFLGFNEYTELAVLLGTGELISSFITLGVHSAVLRENIPGIIIKYYRYNILPFFIIFLIISYAISTKKDHIALLCLISVSISLLKLVRSFIISSKFIFQLTLSYTIQTVTIIFCFFTIFEDSVNSILYIFAFSQLISATFTVAIVFYKGVDRETEIDYGFIGGNVFSFFVRDLASMSSVHLGRSVLFYLGLVEVAGIYSICFAIHSYALQILIPFNQILRPKLRDLFLENNKGVLLFMLRRWQINFLCLGTFLLTCLLLIIYLYEAKIIELTSGPAYLSTYISLMCIATLSAFYFDVYGTWSMLVFRHSNLLIKYLVIIFSCSILCFQVASFLLLGDKGFLVGYILGSIVNNIVTMRIFNYAMKSKPHGANLSQEQMLND